MSDIPKLAVDIVQAGIIDPTKVVRIALENAVSVSSLLLLTEATLTEVREAKKPAAAGAKAREHYPPTTRSTM